MQNETEQYLDEQKLVICSYEKCGSYFWPKKRFAQKYCCESCRVMAYRDRKLGGSVVLNGVYKRATNQDVIDTLKKSNQDLMERIKNFETGAIWGGAAMIFLQVIQLSKTGNLESMTKEQTDFLSGLKEQAKNNKDLAAILGSLIV